jgi:hypothetical protein
MPNHAHHLPPRKRYSPQIKGPAGVTLHSYRYAWAERANTVGYPERFAQEALGHNSKALMRIPPLEEYEKLGAAAVQQHLAYFAQNT